MRAAVAALFVVAAIVGWRAGGGADVQQAAAVDAPRPDGGVLILQRGVGGHFFVNGDVAGKGLRFVVDTGATTVAIGRDDAARIGFQLSDTAFADEVRTASGTIGGARITLPRLRVGDIQLTNVPAVVLDVRDAMPLLGQSFLGRIDHVSIEGDRMTLTKR